MSSGWEFIGYVALKLAAYIVWCYVGLALFWPERKIGLAAGFGVLRLIIGVCFGFGVFLVGGMAHLEAPKNQFLMYLEIYAPVRWFEWGIMAAILSARDRGVAAFLIGSSNRARMWRVGGIVVSILADLPILLSSRGAGEMLPVGRFLC
jgi:hypothetical protein